MNEYVKEMFQVGRCAENIVMDYFISLGYSCSRADYKEYPYDLVVTKPDGKVFTVEVKTYGAPKYKTVFAETLQVSKVHKIHSKTEYLESADQIDYMIYVDVQGSRLFVYNMAEFAKYVLAHKDQATVIGRGTAYGVRVPECSEDAGFRFIADL